MYFMTEYTDNIRWEVDYLKETLSIDMKQHT